MIDFISLLVGLGVGALIGLWLAAVVFGKQPQRPLPPTADFETYALDDKGEVLFRLGRAYNVRILQGHIRYEAEANVYRTSVIHQFRYVSGPSVFVGAATDPNGRPLTMTGGDHMTVFADLGIWGCEQAEPDAMKRQHELEKASSEWSLAPRT